MSMLEGLPPVIGADTRLLVLGSFPGAASLLAQQYYAHPRNQFWRLVGTLLQQDLVSLPYPQRLLAMRDRGLGLWDIYARCRREGSLDQNIELPELNDLEAIARWAPKLAAVAHNGTESARVMRVTKELGYEVHRLPSTSPANASWTFERKLAAWRLAFERAGLID